MTAPGKPAVRLSGHGLGVQLPSRWEGRIYRRATPTAAFPGWGGEQSYPVMHLANFALPTTRGDFGSGAVEIMGTRQIFLALLEFGPECLGTALYEPRGVPRPTPAQFNPNVLQRRVAGQSGFQRFFTEQNRPMCLYVVLGSHREAATLCAEVTAVLDRIEVEPS